MCTIIGFVQTITTFISQSTALTRRKHADARPHKIVTATATHV